jgi:hypothetical protein
MEDKMIIYCDTGDIEDTIETVCMLNKQGDSIEGSLKYIEGKYPPHYPVPAKMDIDPLIKNHILKPILLWLWSR